MVFLRYLYVVALALWVGGLVVAGALVAPSVFGVLQAWNEAQGRVLAGQVFGDVLLRLTWLSYAMAAVMFVTLTLHRLLGARPLRYGVRVGIMGVMLVMMLATGFYIIPEVNAIQAAVVRAGQRVAGYRSAPRRFQSPPRPFKHPVFNHGDWRSGAAAGGKPGSSDRLSAIGCQLSAIGYRLSAIGYRLKTCLHLEQSHSFLATASVRKSRARWCAFSTRRDSRRSGNRFPPARRRWRNTAPRCRSRCSIRSRGTRSR